MKHARLVCNQREKFQCAECRKLTSSGYQLVGDDETKFVCKECYVNTRVQYPMKGKSIRYLIPADVVFSNEYDPMAVEIEEQAEETESSGYIGELVPDGNGGWREPTSEEIRAMNARTTTTTVSKNTESQSDDLSTIIIKYRFTTDNKLQVILPKKCRIDDITYELVVVTEE